MNADLNTDLAIINTDLAILNADLAIINKDLAILNADLAIMNTDLAIMNEDLVIMNEDLAIMNKMHMKDPGILAACWRVSKSRHSFSRYVWSSPPRDRPGCSGKSNRDRQTYNSCHQAKWWS